MPPLLKEQEKQPPKRQDVAQLIVKHGNRIAWLSSLAGLIWVLLFPLVTITTGELKTRGTYFEENALLPTLMTSTLDHVQVRRASDLYREGQKALSEAGPQGYDSWLCGAMEAALAMGGSSVGGSCQAYGGVVWGVLGPAKRSEAQEAVVLVAYRDTLAPAGASWRSQEKDGDEGEGGEVVDMASGVGVSLVLLEEMATRSSPWQHKSIILVVAPGGVSAQDREWAHLPELKTWCDGYMDGRRPYSSPYAGSLRAALIIDLPPTGLGRSFHSFRVLTSGSVGQLPNLDLTHLVTLFLASTTANPPSSSTQAKPPPTVDMDWHASKLAPWGLSAPPSPLMTRRPSGPVVLLPYWHRLSCMLGFMLSLASGATGGHSFFLRRGVESLTIQAVPQKLPPSSAAAANQEAPHGGKKKRPSGADTVQLLQAMHKTLRSLNNLEARLYHGFFLYLMPSPSHFVSLSEYIYSLVLLAPVPLLPRALALSMPMSFASLLDGFCMLVVAEAAGGVALLGLRALPSWGPRLCSSLPSTLQAHRVASREGLAVLWCTAVMVVTSLLLLTLQPRRPPGSSWRTPAALACYMLIQLALAFLNYSLAVLLSLPILLVVVLFFPPADPLPSTDKADNPPQQQRINTLLLCVIRRVRVALGVLTIALVLGGPGLYLLLALLLEPPLTANAAAGAPWSVSSSSSWLVLLDKYLVTDTLLGGDLHVPLYCLSILPATLVLTQALARWIAATALTGGCKIKRPRPPEETVVG